MKLEELARQSSGAARAAVVHLDPPALGADARNRGRIPVLLGAAAVLLIVGMAAFLLTRDDTTETVSAGSVEVPVLGLDDPASFGLTATGMFDPESMAEEFGVENPEVTFVYFGTPGADDPFADGDLLVGELRNETPEPLSDGTPLTVRGGLEASALDPSSDGALPGRSTIEWYEPNGGRVIQMVIASATLDVDELAAVVEQIDLSAGIAEVSLGDETTLPESARGLAPVAVEDDFPSVFGGFRALTSTIVGYERAPELSADVLASVSVASRADTIADSIAADRWWASDTEAIEVNGAAGWQFTYDFDDGTSTESFTTESVVWQWDTGVVASVTATASGGTVSTLELAEAVVELDAATIDGISDGALADQAAADFDEVWGSGTGESPLPGGSVAAWSWAVGTQGDDFCTSFASGSSGASSCQPFSQVLNLAAQAPAVIDQGIMEDLQMGVIVAGADDMVVPAAGTPGDLAEVVVPNDADGTRLLVWVGPSDAPAHFDVLVGGEVVETLDLADGVAGIEESEPVPPVSEGEEATEGVVGIEIDVAANPSAQSLGIAEGFSVEASGGNERIAWVIGTHEGETYIVADGEATFAALLPDDVTVLKPVELPDGTVWTYVVARYVPPCVTLLGLSEVTTQGTDETTGGPGLVVWPIEGTADGWSLVFDRPDADIREAQLQLPDVEGSIAWPETFCGDAATAAPTVAEARRALEGLEIQEALQIATESGWEVRVTRIDGVEQPFEAMFEVRRNRVNIDLVDGVVAVVTGVG